MSTIRVRFAPSPTGSLHIGSARTALFNYLFARHEGGTFVLRIEDTDFKRSVRAHEESIIRDLHWLGLVPDEGPHVGGPYGPYRQSERSHLYEEGVERLLAEGHAYYCFCSEDRLKALKSAQLARGQMPKYDRRCLALPPDEVEARLEAGEKATVRFKVPPGQVDFHDLIRGYLTFSCDVIGDFIIKRSDGGYSYNYAVVVDDIGMKITHVIRGEDHITNTARQLLLFRAFGAAPPIYAHHSMIHAPGGGKLSKRHGATSIGKFRELGYLPEALVNYLALLAWHPSDERELFSLSELVQEFSMARVSRSPAIFDRDKLNWLNGIYIRSLKPSELFDRVAPYFHAARMTFAKEQQETVAAAIQATLVTLADAPRAAEVFVSEVDLSTSPHRDVLRAPGADRVLDAVEQVLAEKEGEYFSVEEGRTILQSIASVCKDAGLKGRTVFMPIRVALTGRNEGPELFYLLAALGKSKILERVRAARRFVAQSSATM